MKHLQEILKMIEANMDFFMIKACLEMIGFTCESMTMRGLKEEVEVLLAHAELEEESLIITAF